MSTSSSDHEVEESPENSVREEDSDHEEKADEQHHLFGRQRPVHVALGGGKSADVILWRNKHISGTVLAAATVIWLLFEWIGYRLVTFMCHFLILSLATWLLCSNLCGFVSKPGFNFPEIRLSEDLCNKVALLLRDRCNQALGSFREIALGRDVKKFLQVLFALWVVSIVGSWFDFLTIAYILFVMTLTMPRLYEKHEDRVDSYALNAKSKLQKQYSSFDERVLQRLPKVPFLKDSKIQ